MARLAAGLLGHEVLPSTDPPLRDSPEAGRNDEGLEELRAAQRLASDVLATPPAAEPGCILAVRLAYERSDRTPHLHSTRSCAPRPTSARSG